MKKDVCDICQAQLKKNNLNFVFPPQKRQLRVKWNRALKKSLNDDSKICQKHFHPDEISIIENEDVEGEAIHVKNAAIPFISPEKPKDGVTRKCRRQNSMYYCAKRDKKSANLEKMDIEGKQDKDQMYLINERLYDAKLDYTESLSYTFTRHSLSTTRTLESDFGNGRFCGLIKVQPTEMVYVMCCFYCDETFPLENTNAFTQHIQDKHIGLENGDDDDDYVENDINTGKCDEGHDNNLDSIESDVESTKDNKIKRRNGTSSKNESSTINTIFMEKVDSKIYFEFIEQLENHPLLWYPPQDSREYAEAMVALTDELNQLWESELKYQDIDASLRHLKEFYYKNLIFNQELPNPYQQYFDKCHRFMPDLDLCRFQKPVTHKEKSNSTKIDSKNKSREEKQDINENYVDFQCQRTSQTTTTKGNFECNVCGRKYVNSVKFQAHVASHTYRDNYLCHICAATFYDKHVYKTHLKRHRGALQCVCKICDLVFRESPRLTDHRKKCHFVLEGTVEELDQKRQMAMQRKSNRNILDQTLRVDPLTKAKYFVCPICEETFRKYAKLYAHKITKHGYKTKSMLSEGNHSLVCEVCNKKLSNILSYNTHKKRHFGLTRCQCKICGLHFRESPRLTAHRKKCHFVLEGTLEELVELEKVLLNLTPQSCKPTTNQKTGLKCYSCSECRMMFPQQNVLLLHKIREHLLRATTKCKKIKNAFNTVEDLMTNFNYKSYTADDLVEQELDEVTQEDECEIVEIFHPTEIELNADSQVEICCDNHHHQQEQQHQLINDIEIDNTIEDEEADNYEEIVEVEVEDTILDSNVNNHNVAVITNNYNGNVVVYSENYYYDQLTD